MAGNVKIKGYPGTKTAIQVPKVANLKKFVVNFRRGKTFTDTNQNISDYVGQYGFDWLRDEYIYPIIKVTHDNQGFPINTETPLCLDVAKLKTEYKDSSLSPYGKDYFPAWLSIFPHTKSVEFKHGSSMHKNGVDLDLEIEELENLSKDATELLFETNNKFLIVTPEKLNLKDLIDKKETKSLGGTDVRDYYLAENKINIKCKSGVLIKDEEVRVFAKLGSKKVEVGKLILSKNNIIPKAEVVAINVLIGGKGGRLRDDYEFIFKRQSYNQALVRAEVDVDTKFNLNNLPQTDQKVLDFIANYSSGTLPSGKSSDNFRKELIELYDLYGKHKPKGGLIDTNVNKRTYLFFTNFSAGNTNGICSAEFNKDISGNITSIDWGNAYIVFDGGSKSKRTLIHECGHSLSLPHIFMAAEGTFKVSSSHVFYKGYTDNYMDYEWQQGAIVWDSVKNKWNRYSSGDNKYKGKMYSFFKWQWDIIRKDESLIKNY
jgi:hypothetical protein